MTWIGWEGYVEDEGRAWFVVNESIVLYSSANSYAIPAKTWIRSGKNECVGDNVACSWKITIAKCKNINACIDAGDI